MISWPPSCLLVYTGVWSHISFYIGWCHSTPSLHPGKNIVNNNSHRHIKPDPGLGK